LAEASFLAVTEDKSQFRVHFRKHTLITLCAGARESCSFNFATTAGETNVAVTLPPLDFEFIPDGVVDLRLGCSLCQHPRHESAPLVYLLPRSLAVCVTLAGANESAFGEFH